MSPVSVKAVVRRGGGVLLGENDRGEWELLGGRPEPGESFEQALVRELQEEAGLAITVGELLLDEPFEVVPGRTVRIIAFRCEVDPGSDARSSDEHRRVAFFPESRLARLRLPAVYRSAIEAAR